jgi:hypothetical protein
MNYFRLLPALVLVLLSYVSSAQATTAEAREVARLYNCSPKKIEVMRSLLGAPSQTLYRVDCNMPKVSGDAGGGATAESVLVKCEGSLCEMIRAVPKRNQ